MAAAFNMASLLGALEETKSLIHLQDEQIKAKQHALELSKRRRSGSSREENRIKETIETLEKRLKSLHDDFDRKNRALRRQGNVEMSNSLSKISELQRKQISELREAMTAIQTQSGALVSEIKALYDILSNLAESAAAEKQEVRHAAQHARALQREADRRFASDLELVIGKMTRVTRSRSRSPMGRSSRSKSRSRSPRRGGATRRQRK